MAPPARALDVKVKMCNMAPELQAMAVDTALEALAHAKVEKDIATSIKRSMDAATSSTWHCIVGADFGCSLAFENKHLLFLQADGKHVLLFKSFDQA